MFFKGELFVKNQGKEFGFFYYFNRLLSQKDAPVWGKSILLHIIFEVENVKPFSHTQSWMLLMHNNLPVHTKSSTNKEQSVPFKTALTMLLILMLNRAGDRMLPCGPPTPCFCSSDRVGPTLTLKEHSDRKL